MYGAILIQCFGVIGALYHAGIWVERCTRGSVSHTGNPSLCRPVPAA
jgi:hypothetical protein